LTWLARDEHSTTCNLAFLYHVGDDAGSPTGLDLANEAIALGPGGKFIIQSEPVDV